jgi:AraC-like DNA-binding protein
MQAKVHSIIRLTAAEQGTQMLPWALISFLGAGQARMSVAEISLQNPAPYLAILPKGVCVDFVYTEQRNQWAILLDMPGLTLGGKPGTVELSEETGVGRVVLPMFTNIVKEHISGWEGEFLRMREAFQTPCPSNRLRVQTGIGNVFRYVIDQRPDIYLSPAAKLRWLIDEDRQARRSLEELSLQCGYSASRMRTLFEQEYGQSPQAYRNKRRMHIAADLLCNSDQRIKEIAELIGCRHVSHFCTIFKNTYSMTPSRYQREFRMRGAR